MANMFNEDGTYNKIELSLEAINNNDIDRHVEADSRLDALESVNADSRLDALESVNADGRLDALTEELETIRLELDAVLKILQDHGFSDVTDE